MSWNYLFLIDGKGLNYFLDFRLTNVMMSDKTILFFDVWTEDYFDTLFLEKWLKLWGVDLLIDEFEEYHVDIRKFADLYPMKAFHLVGEGFSNIVIFIELKSNFRQSNQPHLSKHAYLPHHPSHHPFTIIEPRNKVLRAHNHRTKGQT